ncbi:hypothetical protein P7K49_012305, partial [Saguinus oedipus]
MHRPVRCMAWRREDAGHQEPTARQKGGAHACERSSVEYSGRAEQWVVETCCVRHAPTDKSPDCTTALSG